MEVDKVSVNKYEYLTHTVIIKIIAKITAAVTKPPANRPPPTAGVRRVLVLQSVQALVTVTATPSTVMENGACPMILSAMTEAVSEPSSVEYSTLVV